MTIIGKKTVIIFIISFITFFCIILFKGNDTLSCVVSSLIISLLISFSVFNIQSSNYIINTKSIRNKEKDLWYSENTMKFTRKIGLSVNNEYVNQLNNCKKELKQMQIDFYFTSKQIDYINNDNDVNKYFYKEYLKNKKNNVI